MDTVNIQASDRAELRRILKVLFGLTDNKYEIVLTPVPGNSVRVPEALFAKFEAAEGGSNTETSGATESVAPKKRGRPRKKETEEVDA